MIHWQTVKEFFGFGGDVVTQPLTEGSTKTQVKTQSAGHDHSPPPPPPPQAQRIIEPVTRHEPISVKKALARKAKVNPSHYYKRGGKYYRFVDDCPVDDLDDFVLMYILSELFLEDEIGDYDATVLAYNEDSIAANENTFDVNRVNEVPEDLLDIDVSSTPVVAAPEPSYTPPPAPEPEPEPTRYDSGSSYSSGSSDYGSSDSGSSDSGGGDD